MWVSTACVQRWKLFNCESSYAINHQHGAFDKTVFLLVLIKTRQLFGALSFGAGYAGRWAQTPPTKQMNGKTWWEGEQQTKVGLLDLVIRRLVSDQKNGFKSEIFLIFVNFLKPFVSCWKLTVRASTYRLEKGCHSHACFVRMIKTVLIQLLSDNCLWSIVQIISQRKTVSSWTSYWSVQTKPAGESWQPQ